MNPKGQASRYLEPDWPAPVNVRAVSTCRDLQGFPMGEASNGLAGFNLARHVHDDPARVERHRSLLQRDLGLERQPFWLNQTHSTDLLKLPAPAGLYNRDGSYTQTKNWPCVVMTADCLPVLLCDTAGSQVAAVHAGWQGLANGIVAKAVAQFSDPSQVIAWIGPAIGAGAFEVGPDVLRAFGVDPQQQADDFFPISHKHEKWLGNLYTLARKQLNSLGVKQVFGGQYCTLSNPDTFYSHRRDPSSGRMASLIWLV